MELIRILAHVFEMHVISTMIGMLLGVPEGLPRA